MAKSPDPTVESNRAPNLLPFVLVLGILLWIVVMTGGRQVFVKELLGGAYDSQADHLLRGDPGVDGDAIGWEAMIVNGKTRMYFGPFPALFRIPLNFVYPAGKGSWSRISGFCAGMVAIFGVAGLVRMSLLSSQLTPLWRNLIAYACLAGLVFGSPLLLLLGNLSLYHEAIAWALAWALAAVYFACRSRKAEGAALTRSLLGFSFCVAAAFLSRVTFGAPFFLIAPLLALRLLRKDQIHNLVALFLPMGLGLISYLVLNYAKVGNFRGMDLNYHINQEQREFAQKHGLFRPERIPYSFANYFFLRRPELQHDFPFIRTGRAPFNHPTLFVHPFTQTYSSLLWCSSWILLGAMMGVIFLLQPKYTDGLDRAIAAVLLVQVVAILSYMGVEQRYAAEFYPFLFFCLFIFFQRDGIALIRVRYLVLGLVIVSIAINSLATASWLGTVDGSVTPETRAFWTMTPVQE